MKLNKYHLGYKDPKPESGPELEEWTRRNVEPEPEWVYLKDKKPEKGQSVLVKHVDRIEIYGRAWLGKETWKPEEYHKWIWADRPLYTKALSYYKQFQKIFDGWELRESDTKDDCYLFRKNRLLARTFKDEKVQITVGMPAFNFYGSITPEYFRGILEMNGYEA